MDLSRHFILLFPKKQYFFGIDSLKVVTFGDFLFSPPCFFIRQWPLMPVNCDGPLMAIIVLLLSGEQYPSLYA